MSKRTVERHRQRPQIEHSADAAESESETGTETEESEDSSEDSESTNSAKIRPAKRARIEENDDLVSM